MLEHSGPRPELLARLFPKRLDLVVRDVVHRGVDLGVQFSQLNLSSWCAAAPDGLADAVTASASVIDFDSVLIDGKIPAQIRKRRVDETSKALHTRNFAGIQVPDFREGSIGPEAQGLGAASLPLTDRYLVEGHTLLNRAN